MKFICKIIGIFFLALIHVTVAIAQKPSQGTCKVKVLDENGLSVPGATVIVKGTGTGAVADANGICILPSVNYGATLVVSCLGYTDTECIFTGTPITVSIQSSFEFLDDVVVVGYGTQRKKDITGAITQVKGDVVNEFAGAGAARLLQGRIAGVQVQTNSGNPGNTVQITIRGANSVKGDSSPLWIINGFPGDISMINSSDIETIDVLKDASATAIYGSRGANGVIMVTTKGARDGAVAVDYNGSIGVQSLAKKIEMMDAQQYMLFINEKNEINGKPKVFSADEIISPRANTDWQDEVFRNALITSHSISTRGGNEKFQAALSASYFSQDGIIKSSDYSRYSINGDLKFNPKKWLSIRSNIIISRIDQNRMSSESAGRESSVTSNALLSSPLARVYNADGTFAYDADLPVSPRNAVAYLNEVKNKRQYDKNKASLSFIFKPVKGLNLELSGNRQSSQYRADLYTPNTYMNANSAEAQILTTETVDYVLNGIATYDRTFSDKHRFSILGGASY